MLFRSVEPYDAWKTEISLPQSAQRPSEIPVNDHFASAFYIRMLFSCLVDADFLDTETFMDGAPKPRGEGYASMEELFDRFMRYFSAWEAPPSSLNSRRNEIFQTCLDVYKRQVAPCFAEQMNAKKYAQKTNKQLGSVDE